MSIVYEYLKEIQQRKDPPVVQKIVPVPELKKAFKIPSAAVGVWVLIGLLVLGAGYLMISRGTGQAEINVYKPKQKHTVKRAVADAGYVLEGIIYNPDHPFAIINGQMLEKDGQIDDFVVTSITPNTVSLKNTRDNTGRTLQL